MSSMSAFGCIADSLYLGDENKSFTINLDFESKQRLKFTANFSKVVDWG